MDETPQVLVIEATNALLINATWEQHQRIQSVLKYLDVTQADRRHPQVYPIEHVDAEEVLQKLDELGVTQINHSSPARASKSPPKPNRISQTAPPMTSSQDNAFVQAAPQVVVLDATNALLVNATTRQHQEIQRIIQLVDVITPIEAIPYEIYFLENQSPTHVAEILSKLVQETITDKEGKITQQVTRTTDDQIVIVPDELTFSLIVYANRKNQDWLGTLISKLDREQSQVLIDVTLVEISKTDEFNFDLNIISSIPDLAATSGLMGPIAGAGENAITTKNIMDRLAASGRSRFMDMQSNSGAGTGFYGDKHVHLLIEAMEEKKYGRVLAKPKVLVNDNETGTISTQDTTYVKQTKQSALPGNDNAVITSEEFTSYDAGITLNIVPHINEDDLLRLNINLKRSDFIPTEGEKPPDSSSSDITTVVTIPDGSTIILGGMLKLNQSKNATKVPGLGDLPLLGGLFRGTNRSDLQKRLYIFVKAEIIRPAEALQDRQQWDLNRLSQENRQAFEATEKEFQDHQLWPGTKPKPTEPINVLDER